MTTLKLLRDKYHTRVCEEIIRISVSRGGVEYPNFADVGSKNSIAIALGIVKQLVYSTNYDILKGQTAGGKFEEATKDFLEETFTLLHPIRPGNWFYSTKMPISRFDQYEHLAALDLMVRNNPTLASVLGGDYVIKPDIVVARWPVGDDQINCADVKIVDNEHKTAKLTPLRRSNYPEDWMLLHASISCKWTIRSDRSQNSRTEALNLIRNRKGGVPKIVAVTGEPLPMRISSLALGTGDLDCVYHFALYELEASIKELLEKGFPGIDDQAEELRNLIIGRRLRDISDLPFDLAI